MILDHTGAPWKSAPRPHVFSNGEALPHVFTYGALLTSASREFAYFQDRFDEARRHGADDAKVMVNDCFLMALVNERRRAVSGLKWSLHVPDEKDRRQVQVRDHIKATLDGMRGEYSFRRIVQQQSWAVWYGRYATQVKWTWQTLSSAAFPQGLKTLTVARHLPVNGDKIGHLRDHTPYVLINPSEPIRGAETDFPLGTQGGRALILRGTWRDRFLLHKHEPFDADFMDSDAAEAVHGVGVRSVIFLVDWLRREWLANITEFMNRIGLGFEIWEFEEGNHEAEQRMLALAKQKTGRVHIVIPKRADGELGNNVRRVEVPTAGAQFLLELIEHLRGDIERYIVGQSMSGGGGERSDGLGGTGRANFARDTKGDITEDDAHHMGGGLTGSPTSPSLVYMIQRHTFPWSAPEMPGGFTVDLRFGAEEPEDENRLLGIKTIVEMGVPVKVSDVYAAAGLGKPGEGDDVVQLPMAPPPGAAPGGPPGPPPSPDGAQPSPDEIAALEQAGAIPGGLSPEDLDALFGPSPMTGMVPMARRERPAQYASDDEYIEAIRGHLNQNPHDESAWNQLQDLHTERGDLEGVDPLHVAAGRAFLSSHGHHNPHDLPPPHLRVEDRHNLSLPEAARLALARDRMMGLDVNVRQPPGTPDWLELHGISPASSEYLHAYKRAPANMSPEEGQRYEAALRRWGAFGQLLHYLRRQQRSQQPQQLARHGQPQHYASREQFEQHLEANPGDSDTRRVYGDFLKEQGQEQEGQEQHELAGMEPLHVRAGHSFRNMRFYNWASEPGDNQRLSLLQASRMAQHLHAQQQLEPGDLAGQRAAYIRFMVAAGLSPEAAELSMANGLPRNHPERERLIRNNHWAVHLENLLGEEPEQSSRVDTPALYDLDDRLSSLAGQARAPYVPPAAPPEGRLDSLASQARSTPTAPPSVHKSIGHAVAEQFGHGHFDGRQHRVSFGDRILHVGHHPDHDAAWVDFFNDPSSGMGESQVAGKLRKGSVDFARKVLGLVGSLRERNVPVYFLANPRKSAAYARLLGGAGYKRREGQGKQLGEVWEPDPGWKQQGQEQAQQYAAEDIQGVGDPRFPGSNDAAIAALQQHLGRRRTDQQAHAQLSDALRDAGRDQEADEHLRLSQADYAHLRAASGLMHRAQPMGLSLGRMTQLVDAAGRALMRNRKQGDLDALHREYLESIGHPVPSDQSLQDAWQGLALHPHAHGLWADLLNAARGMHHDSPLENIARDRARADWMKLQRRDRPSLYADYSFSTTQFDLEGEAAQRTLAMGKKVAEEDLHEKGREEQIHLTCVYGLHTANPDKVRNLVASFGPVKVTLGKSSIFPARKGKGYDVVKVDVEGDSLHRLHQHLCDNLEYTSEHKEYTPHITLAYVRAGKGKGYEGMDDVEGLEITFDALTFSDESGNRTLIPLTPRREKEKPPTLTEQPAELECGTEPSRYAHEDILGAGGPRFSSPNVQQLEQLRAAASQEPHDPSRHAVLADALEDAGHPDAAMHRQLATMDPLHLRAGHEFLQRTEHRGLPLDHGHLSLLDAARLAELRLRMRQTADQGVEAPGNSQLEREWFSRAGVGPQGLAHIETTNYGPESDEITGTWDRANWERGWRWRLTMNRVLRALQQGGQQQMARAARPSLYADPISPETPRPLRHGDLRAPVTVGEADPRHLQPLEQHVRSNPMDQAARAQLADLHEDLGNHEEAAWHRNAHKYLPFFTDPRTGQRTPETDSMLRESGHGLPNVRRGPAWEAQRKMPHVEDAARFYAPFIDHLELLAQRDPGLAQDWNATHAYRLGEAWNRLHGHTQPQQLPGQPIDMAHPYNFSRTGLHQFYQLWRRLRAQQPQGQQQYAMSEPERQVTAQHALGRLQARLNRVPHDHAARAQYADALEDVGQSEEAVRHRALAQMEPRYVRLGNAFLQTPNHPHLGEPLGHEGLHLQDAARMAQLVHQASYSGWGGYADARRQFYDLAGFPHNYPTREDDPNVPRFHQIGRWWGTLDHMIRSNPWHQHFMGERNRPPQQSSQPDYPAQYVTDERGNEHGRDGKFTASGTGAPPPREEPLSDKPPYPREADPQKYRKQVKDAIRAYQQEPGPYNLRGLEALLSPKDVKRVVDACKALKAGKGCDEEVLRDYPELSQYANEDLRSIGTPRFAGANPQALQALHQHLSNQPDDHLARMQLADLHEDMGNSDEAGMHRRLAQADPLHVRVAHELRHSGVPMDRLATLAGIVDRNWEHAQRGQYGTGLGQWMQTMGHQWPTNQSAQEAWRAARQQPFGQNWEALWDDISNILHEERLGHSAQQRQASRARADWMQLSRRDRPQQYGLTEQGHAQGALEGLRRRVETNPADSHSRQVLADALEDVHGPDHPEAQSHRRLAAYHPDVLHHAAESWLRPGMVGLDADHVQGLGFEGLADLAHIAHSAPWQGYGFPESPERQTWEQSLRRFFDRGGGQDVPTAGQEALLRGRQVFDRHQQLSDLWSHFRGLLRPRQQPTLPGQYARRDNAPAPTLREQPMKYSSQDSADTPLATPEQIAQHVRETHPSQLRPVNVVGHLPHSARAVNQIADSMRSHGWQGLPLLGVRRDDDWQALTGSHRLAAAQRADLDSIPVVWLHHHDVLRWAAAAGYNLPRDADLTDLDDEDRLAILMAGDHPVAKEIMRQEVAKEPQQFSRRERPMHYNRESFEQHLNANPGDAQTRMVFADWLEDQHGPGHPEAAEQRELAGMDPEHVHAAHLFKSQPVTAIGRHPMHHDGLRLSQAARMASAMDRNIQIPVGAPGKRESHLNWLLAAGVPEATAQLAVEHRQVPFDDPGRPQWLLASRWGRELWGALVRLRHPEFPPVQ